MDHKRDNQLCITHLQQVSGLWGRQEWPHSVHHGCVAVFQIQDPALVLGVDGVCMGLGKARGNNMSHIPLGDMPGMDLCWGGGKKSHYHVILLSSHTCNTIFVDFLVQDVYGNVPIRIGR